MPMLTMGARISGSKGRIAPPPSPSFWPPPLLPTQSPSLSPQLTSTSSLQSPSPSPPPSPSPSQPGSAPAPLFCPCSFAQVEDHSGGRGHGIGGHKDRHPDPTNAGREYSRFLVHYSHLLTHSLTRSQNDSQNNHLLVHYPTYSLDHLHSQSLTHTQPPTPSLTFTHPLFPSPTPTLLYLVPLSQSLTHLSTHALNYPRKSSCPLPLSHSDSSYHSHTDSHTHAPTHSPHRRPSTPPPCWSSLTVCRRSCAPIAFSCWMQAVWPSSTPRVNS